MKRLANSFSGKFVFSAFSLNMYQEIHKTTMNSNTRSFLLLVMTLRLLEQNRRQKLITLQPVIKLLNVSFRHLLSCLYLILVLGSQ
jgi:hypothetical protein